VSQVLLLYEGFETRILHVFPLSPYVGLTNLDLIILTCKILYVFRLQDIDLFKRLLADDKYKADPVTSVSSYVHSKVYEELMDDS
jgi:hypothetical protein